MAGYVVVKVRCQHCMKKIVSSNDTNVCRCDKPKPVRISTRVMHPIDIPARALVREAVACAS